MIPDEQGRFGFNVKGGADQGMPIIVSRVAPNTPADNCIPRLNEGDQVLFINGRDVSQHTHEQVCRPGTSYNCIPQLIEGDQVLFINGRDVSQHTHNRYVDRVPVTTVNLALLRETRCCYEQNKFHA